jgi:AraC family transcriptional regulator, transcriptional activator of pobA
MLAIYYLYIKGQNMGDHKADKILDIDNLASFERQIHGDHTPYKIDMMVLPRTMSEKQKNFDPSTDNPVLRNRFHLIYLLLDGDYEINIGGEHYHLRSNDLVIVPENMVYEIPHLYHCSGYCVNFVSELLLPLKLGPISSEFPYLDVEAIHVINLSAAERKKVQKSFKDINREYNTFSSSERDNLLKHYLEILLIRIREIFRPYSNKKLSSHNKALHIANTFKVMVEKNFRQIRQVKDYAAMLNISAGHLSHTVQEAFGKSPRDVINDVLLLEAKMLLSTTDKSLVEIAYLLQFNDQSHFNHFMKHHTDLSPRELRKIL